METVELPAGSRCALCGKVLAGQIAWDQHRQFFCGSHAAVGRHCRFCDRFFLPDSNADHCPVCRRFRVATDAAALAECDAVAQWYGANGLTLPRPLPPVALHSELGMSPLLSGTRKLGEVAWRSVPMTMRREALRITIAGGLPAALLSAVMAHEFGHLALAHLDLPAWVEEGSCDWLAHRYLAGIPGREAAIQQRRIEQRRDNVYGAGFRWISGRLGRSEPHRLVSFLQSQWPPCGRSG